MADTKQTDKTKLIEEIVRLQHQMGSAMRRNEPEALMELDLTIAQLKSLHFIDIKGSTNLGNLAAALGTTPPNVTGIVERLVEQGLVSRQDNPANRRMLLLQVTDKGKDLLAKLRESGQSRMSGILNKLNTDELAALVKGLSAVIRVVSSQPEGGSDDEHHRS